MKIIKMQLADIIYDPTITCSRSLQTLFFILSRTIICLSLYKSYSSLNSSFIDSGIESNLLIAVNGNNRDVIVGHYI